MKLRFGRDFLRLSIGGSVPIGNSIWYALSVDVLSRRIYCFPILRGELVRILKISHPGVAQLQQIRDHLRTTRSVTLLDDGDYLA